jgi:hypothetical protein
LSGVFGPHPNPLPGYRTRENEEYRERGNEGKKRR